MSVGFRRVMLVIDDRFGGDEAPGVYWQSEEDTLEQCDPESLAIVGTVTNAALRDVVALLRKVDRFSERPVPAPPPEPAEAPDSAEAADTPEPAEGAETPDSAEAADTPDSAEAVETAEPPEGELSE